MMAFSSSVLCGNVAFVPRIKNSPSISSNNFRCSINSVPFNNLIDFVFDISIDWRKRYLFCYKIESGVRLFHKHFDTSNGCTSKPIEGHFEKCRIKCKHIATVKIALIETSTATKIF